MTTETQATAASSGAGATARFRENKHIGAGTSQERVSTLAGRVIKAINDTVLDEKVTYDEYNAFKAWLIQVGEDGEWPLFLGVWVEHSVEEVANALQSPSRHSPGARPPSGSAASQPRFRTRPSNQSMDPAKCAMSVCPRPMRCWVAMRAPNSWFSEYVNVWSR